MARNLTPYKAAISDGWTNDASVYPPYLCRAGSPKLAYCIPNLKELELGRLEFNFYVLSEGQTSIKNYS